MKVAWSIETVSYDAVIDGKPVTVSRRTDDGGVRHRLLVDGKETETEQAENIFRAAREDFA